VSLLTNSSHASTALSSASGDESQGSGVDARKEAFLAHVRDYFSTLKGLEKALEKQTIALEDAGIIPAEREQQFVESGIANGGLGNLDVAWLNSRRRDVGLGKEQELRAEAKTWLDEAGEIKDEVMEDA
jgi:Mediator complex protein